MEIMNDPNCQPKKYRHSYLNSTLVLILVTLMVRFGEACGGTLNSGGKSVPRGVIRHLGGGGTLIYGVSSETCSNISLQCPLRIAIIYRTHPLKCSLMIAIIQWEQ